ncbi:GNAT family N-acetyltransferase [Actinopolymorpha cephalotaxi]|uniref:Acetyltransferase n=1 Tax=Actinopolymorpha cephalotaxi TaxID=504797 RepID=A0ABX2S5K5_9ACTN|nr:GNAT family N-acetyltransferase [Actinopolymorpha cephalotaxi]NYH84922.1 putative acetyltransferase [Actinopolymorpha cephalotaxi]
MTDTTTSLHRMTDADRPLIDRLWQLYAHDLSEFRGTMPDAAGLFKWTRVPDYFDDPDRCGYLVLHGSAPAGFALVRGLKDDSRLMGEFFVVRAVRRRGVGHDVALELLRLHPGRWEIPFQEENPGAARFWRRIATEVAGDRWTEERRPVPGKPQIPPDVWLSLTV